MSRVAVMRALGAALVAAVTAGGVATFASGCTTDAYCFDCPPPSGSTGTTPSGSGTGGHAGGVVIGTGGEGGCLFNCDDGGMVDACVPSADPTEICDGVDNDCDGKVDNLPTDQFSDPHSC